MPGGPQRWLLIGNSRWHWAESLRPGGIVRSCHDLRCWHSAPQDPLPDTELPETYGVRAWAAVGPVGLNLPADRRFCLERVPLGAMPSWLGIDRALAGWAAWRRRQAAGGGAVLVADAGTTLSLTRVDSQAGFAGGRLLPGAALQLRAMGEATEHLPAVDLPAAPDPPGDWPVATAEAMRSGCLWGLAAAITEAWRNACAEGSVELWLTGGDAPLLGPLLRQLETSFRMEPELCLEGLALLSSDPDPTGSGRPSLRP